MLRSCPFVFKPGFYILLHKWSQRAYKVVCEYQPNSSSAEVCFSRLSFWLVTSRKEKNASSYIQDNASSLTASAAAFEVLTILHWDPDGGWQITDLLSMIMYIFSLKYFETLSHKDDSVNVLRHKEEPSKIKITDWYSRWKVLEGKNGGCPSQCGEKKLKKRSMDTAYSLL